MPQLLLTQFHASADVSRDHILSKKAAPPRAPGKRRAEGGPPQPAALFSRVMIGSLNSLIVAPHDKIPHRRAGYQIEKIDGKEGFGSGDGHLWRALSRRHDHRFGKFLLHLKGLNAVLAAEPLTRNRGVQRKLGILSWGATIITSSSKLTRFTEA